MQLPGHYWLLIFTTIIHLVVSLVEKLNLPAPGKLIKINNCKLHLIVKGSGETTVILDHSLGGIEGYLLVDKIAKLTRVIVYDRPGYGYSEASPTPRCSREIVQELDELLTKAKIQPPYILIGDSFGSYNMRLYAYQYPEKVQGLILSDGLHESGMLHMSPQVKVVKYLFLAGFLMSFLGSALGLIHLLGIFRIFELIKPELKKFPQQNIRRIKKSFYQPQHWLTMTRELWGLGRSGRQVQVANDLRHLPIISLKSKSFFQSSLFTLVLPLRSINLLRDKMHAKLRQLSSNCTEISADNSSHFIWTDQPELIVQAVEQLLQHTDNHNQ